MSVAVSDPPVDETGIPLGHDPACDYWLRLRRRTLSQPMLVEIRHRQTCERCMEYAEWVAGIVRESGYVNPRGVA